MYHKEITHKLHQYGKLKEEYDNLSFEKESIERKLNCSEEEYLKENREKAPEVKKSNRYKTVEEEDLQKLRKKRGYLIISVAVALAFLIIFIILKDLFFLYGVIIGVIAAFVFLKNIRQEQAKQIEQTALYEEQEKQHTVLETEFNDKYAEWEEFVKKSYQQEQKKNRKRLKETLEKMEENERAQFQLDQELGIPFLSALEAYDVHQICGILEENETFSFEKAKELYQKQKQEEKNRLQAEWTKMEEEEEREKEERRRLKEERRELLDEQKRHNQEMERYAKEQARFTSKTNLEQKKAEEKARWNAHIEKERARKMCSRCAHLLKCRKYGTPNCPTFTPDK